MDTAFVNMNLMILTSLYLIDHSNLQPPSDRNLTINMSAPINMAAHQTKSVFQKAGFAPTQEERTPAHYLWVKVLLWTCIMSVCVCGASEDAKIPLYVGGLWPMTGPGWRGGAEALPAIELAVEVLNNSTDILPNHEIKLIWNDTRVSSVDLPIHL